MTDSDFGVTERDRLDRSDFRLNSRLFGFFKMAFDKTVALMCLPPLLMTCLALLLLNPRYNPGPLFYSQVRMGRGGKPFRMYKFRTMLPEGAARRSHSCGVETARITPLGRVLRKYRIDELPNMLNVLRHEMSVIGPRPDTYDHAKTFCEVVPGYRERHRVLPGITGLAQVRAGYAEGIEQTSVKARYDLHYIRKQGFRSEIRIVGMTIRVILSGFGAR